jgi:hypothetical protein
MIKINTLKGYEQLLSHYYLSNDLKIISEITGKEISYRINGSGYMSCNLTRSDGKQTTALIHRIIAEAYVPNPFGLPEVNHKDENKLNNIVKNLEWCTHRYNCLYGTRIKRYSEKNMKQVKQMNKSGDIVAIYPSIIHAAKAMGFKSANSIGQCLRGIKPTGGGYKWDYA